MIDKDGNLVSTERAIGFRCFTTVNELKGYIKKKVLAQLDNSNGEEAVA